MTDQNLWKINQSPNFKKFSNLHIIFLFSKNKTENDEHKIYIKHLNYFGAKQNIR
jgi:hypothetical protein